MCNYKDRFQILIIGTGNIGFRHLQGFVNMELPIDLHVVEIKLRQ